MEGKRGEERQEGRGTIEGKRGMGEGIESSGRDTWGMEEGSKVEEEVRGETCIEGKEGWEGMGKGELNDMRGEGERERGNEPREEITVTLG